MPLFQKNVFRTYWEQTRALPACQDAYKRMQVHFGNPKMQQKICTLKEEQYQEGFLRDLFVQVLDYTLEPQENHNLTTELKNPNSNQKVDGAIVDGAKVKAVIELKSSKTIDLHGVWIQAFSYKNSHKGCKYVLTSNFVKLRFYVDDSSEFLEFDLFNMTEETFAQLYTVLHKDSILHDLPAKIKADSLAREEELTIRFYEDYQAQRDLLFANILSFNKRDGKSATELLSATQKLLDRIIFICFAEDKRLLPVNLLDQIIKNWKILIDLEGTEIPLYERFKKYFNYLNKGNKGKPHDIFGYNGGLFAPDAMLDSLIIQDIVLEKVVDKLSIYNFDSDIDVNILGHIFEHSLSVLGAQHALLHKGATNINLRKQDGIFYTPRTITRYMVAHSLGKMCEAKKETLHLIHIDFDNEDAKPIIQDAILKYEDWLHQLRVLDPACGSGAFLNQVLDFFVQEYEWLEGLKKIILLTNTQESQSNYIHQILENNIFGVDLNFDSVQITKLSLWLRTAQSRVKLNDLSGNIKQGNSIVDNSQVSIVAFDWEKEFPKVFANGGKFDLIIGNPPYVRQELLGEQAKKYFQKRYPSVYNGAGDLYLYFYAKALELLDVDGWLAYITPNKWMERKYGFELRKVLKPLQIKKIVNFGELPIFDDASVETAIIVLQNKVSQDDVLFATPKTMQEVEELEKVVFDTYKKSDLDEHIWRFTKDEQQSIVHKFLQGGVKLKDYTKKEVLYGVKTGLNEAFIIQENVRNLILQKEAKAFSILRKMVEGDDFGKWHLTHSGRYMIATEFELDVPTLYPEVFKYLDKFKVKLESRQDKGKGYWNLRACSYYEEFDKPKLIYYHTALNHSFYYDTEGYYISANCYMIANADRYLQCLLNSKLFGFVKKYLFPAFGDAENGGRVRLDANKMNELPIRQISDTQKQVFAQKAEALHDWSKRLHQLGARFLQVVQMQFKPEKISKKLENWLELDLGVFFDEIKNQKGTITTQQKLDFIPIFETNQKEAQALALEIRKHEQELNEMLYALYGFSPSEITTIENI